MIKTTKNKKVYFTFVNNTDVVKYLDDNAEKVHASEYYTRPAEEFTNHKTYKQAFKGLKYGDTNYNNVFLDALKDANGDADAVSYNFDVTGLFYDMGAVVMGTPENAFNITNDGDGKKQIKIYVDIVFSYGINNKYLLNRGVAIFNLLNTLILKGYILDVNFVCNTHNRMIDKTYYFTFKLPENEVNIPTIAHYTSPEFFRVINFVLLDINGSDPSCCRGKNDAKQFTDGLYINAGYTPSGDIDRKAIDAIKTPEKAKQYIIDLFNNYISKIEK